MKRRTRTFAGLMALVALTASFSEAIMASACAHPATMEDMPSMAMSLDRTEGGTAEDGGPECPGLGQFDQEGNGCESCPLAPIASQGCSSPASAPAAAMSVGLVAPASVGQAASDAGVNERLFAALLYRPPRA